MKWTAPGLLLLAAFTAGAEEPRLFDPYERVKSGPPLAGVFAKADPAWLFVKLRRPRHASEAEAARMPDLGLSDEEVLDVLAFLRTLEAPPVEDAGWPAWAELSEDEMDDDAWEEMTDLVDRGKAVWRQARCTICHRVNGPGERPIGAFVDLRTGGVDLREAGWKLRRDWLNAWLENPRALHPQTLMPRFHFDDGKQDDGERRALVEYILRDEAFRSEPPEDLDVPGTLFDGRVDAGRRLVELSRCVACHDVPGIAELLPAPPAAEPPPPGTFEALAWDLRCLSCHAFGQRGGTYAPDLRGAGSRLQEAWTAAFLEAPDLLRPLSQQMPRFGLREEEAALAAAALAGYRDDTIPEDVPGGPWTEDEAQRGRTLFVERGCVDCHSSEDGGGVVGPTLDRVGERLRGAYVVHHLLHPRALRTRSAEPDLGLSEEEAREIAAYLLLGRTP